MPTTPSRALPRPGEDAAPWLGGAFRFGVPPAEPARILRRRCGRRALLRRPSRAWKRSADARVEIDFSVFRAAAELLYAGPWVAERYAAIRDFIEAHADEMNPVVRGIIEGARSATTAADAFAAEYRLRDLRRAAEAQWERMDVLVLPTTGTIYTHEAGRRRSGALNTNLGYYTNFVNLLDLAAVAVPAGFRANGLPFGVSFIGPAFSDEALLALADRFQRARPRRGRIDWRRPAASRSRWWARTSPGSP